jgi:putative Holliday junction resolvase
LSDAGGILATPLTVIDRTDASGGLDSILQIISERGVQMIVVGLPVSMQGSLGAQAGKVHEFVERLSARVAVPIEMRDERLSTVSAKRLFKEASGRRPKKRVRDDDLAAAVILQGYLDEKIDSTGHGA